MDNIVVRDIDPNKPKKKANPNADSIIVGIIILIILFAILEYFGIQAIGLRTFNLY